ncbi:glycosyltransferase [Egicoccus sp. AB-alg2]|uniref:glycosyltransferase n=1 Tax=Egicoccus sp. AB-alg2 TaxID=3242693 RepID=UPI00359E57E6
MPEKDMPSMHVVIAATSANTIAAFLLPYIRWHRRRGHYVTTVAGAGLIPPGALESDSHLPIHLNRSPKSALRGGMHLFCELRRVSKPADLVVTHTPIVSALLRLAVRSLPARERPKVIYIAHGFHFHTNGRPVANLIFKLIEGTWSRFTDAVVTINREDYHLATTSRLFARERVHYMPGIGISVADYSNVARDRSSAFARSLSVNQDASLVGVIGNFDPGKRQLDVLTALNLVSKERRPTVIFAGDGRLHDVCIGRASDLGLLPWVRFIGRTDRVPELLSVIDVLLMPSEREGLPRSVLEALASGTPIIGARARGTAELLEGHGWLFDVGDTAELAQLLERVGSRASLPPLPAATFINRYSITESLSAYSQIVCRVTSSF